MAADVLLVPQEAGASATMIFILSIRIISVPHVKG